MYRFYNANPKNNNITDCFIRALSCATGESWDHTYNKISDLAQWDGNTMDNRNFIIKYLDRNFRRMPKFYGTIGEASNFYSDNIILISTPGHIVCSKFGNVYDSWDSSYEEAEFIWLVERE